MLAHLFRVHLLTALLALACLLATQAIYAEAMPLKVYILAGQSNMEGHAKVRTFGYVGEDPKTAALYDLMTDDRGKPVTAERVYVSNATEFFDNQGVVTGKLTAGFGGRQNPSELGDNIGPEYTFGLTMQEHHDGPILIIKTAWGGKSLHTDFRPPSAGPYELNDWQLENYPKQQGHGIPKDFAQWKVDKKAATGVYYRRMIDHINRVLADPGQIVPGYDKEAGYEIAGFVWFQGWNDMVEAQTYQWAWKEQRFDQYSKWLSLLITDVRKELDTPELPVVIGVMGIGGVFDENSKGYEKNAQVIFRKAMAAPAETMDKVVAVETAPYWDVPLGTIDMKRQQIRAMAWKLRSKNEHGPNADGSMDDAAQRAYLDKMRDELITAEDNARWERGASNAGYHYLGCAKTMAQIGEAFAKALLE